MDMGWAASTGYQCIWICNIHGITVDRLVHSMQQTSVRRSSIRLGTSTIHRETVKPDLEHPQGNNEAPQGNSEPGLGTIPRTTMKLDLEHPLGNSEPGLGTIPRITVKLDLEHQQGYSEPGMGNILRAIVKLDLVTSNCNVTVNATRFTP